MTKILLINCNLATSPYPVFPMGVAQIAGALLAQGFDVRQLDIQASGMTIEQLLEANRAFEPDAIGLSIRNIDDVDSHQGMDRWYLQQAKNICETIKAEHKAPIIIGGAGVSLMAEKIRSFVGADFAISGEGERATVNLIRDLENNKWQINGLERVYSAPAISGEEIPSPYLDKDITKFYLEKSGMIGIQSKRGCPYQCAYCSYPFLEGRVLRHRPPEDIAKQMATMYHEHGVNDFVFCDSVFNDPEGKYLKVAQAIKDLNLPIRWSGYFRPSNTSKETLAFLKETGLYALELGTDSASDTTLKAMRKPFSFAEVIAFSQSCAELELAQAHFIIMGGPAETLETAQEGLANIAQLPRSIVFVFQGARILPNTHIETISVKEKVISPDDKLLKPTYYHSPHIDEAELSELISRAFQKDMTRIFPPSEGADMEKAMRSLGFKGLLWDRLLVKKKRKRVCKK